MSETVGGDLAALVRRRAGDRCEYCRMHQALQGATFHLEHVRPRSRGGATDAANLALACPSCNLRKSDRLTVPDPATGRLVPLFHPRRQAWADHLAWDGLSLLGRTAVGRAAVAALDLNNDRRRQIRGAEALFALHPPPGGGE